MTGAARAFDTSGGSSTVGLVIGIISGVLCAVGSAAGAYFYMKKKQTPKVAVVS